MKIAVYGQFYQKQSEASVERLLNFLLNQDVQVYVETHFFDLIKHQLKDSALYSSNFKTFKQLDSSFKVLVSIGGDGTILRAITYVKDLDIPIVGINAGRLGFLATIQENAIEDAMHHIINNNYKISNRSLISIETFLITTYRRFRIINKFIQDIITLISWFGSCIGDVRCSYYDDFAAGASS